MLKLNSSYTKKVPVEDLEFSSQSCHCAVEIELPDGLTPEQLRQRIHQTFELVRSSVEAELGGRKPAVQTEVRTAEQREPRPDRSHPASQKQIAYLRMLAARRGMGPAELERIISEQFGRSSLNELGRDSASKLIDRLGSGTRKAA